ncbi:tetratricopeptide repeat protein [Streptomyces sp. B1866]|uniref:tetratricopeptide repeat protein n=1 Tax=Streptomyces sp. B1866 TaxID=3075431 RepID=UPI0028912229|nr:tetratricopeptide repeat protein [Streptomyces sp. B1866]MDT3400614.1 tetratricopeptide repeat protein [Streptomyces sp. B1866]
MLEREDVRAALVRHDFGTVFFLARKWGGISFSRLAEACDIKPERVGRIARGDSRITSIEKIEWIADALRIPGHLLRLAPRPWEDDAFASARATAAASAALSVPTTRPGPWDVADLVRHAQASDVSAAEMETVETAIDRLCRAYPHTPAAELHRQTRLGIRHVSRLLEGRTTLRQHRDLLVHAGWLFLLGGCVEYDLGQHQAADTSRAAALAIGRETGHGEIAAWAWELGAWFALTQGRWSDAVDCVDAGHEADSTHSVGVQLYAQQAKAYARMGDARSVRNALDAGRARLERLPRPDHPEHHFIIDPAKWDFYAMDSYRLLGDDDRAVRHAREVVRTSTARNGREVSPMRAAEARLTLGVTAARAGELEEAVAMGTRALETPRKSLPSLLTVADELGSELRRRYPGEPRARAFHERVAGIAGA